MDKVKRKGERRGRGGRTRISTKNQATIPVEALRKSGLNPGDELLVTSDGPGRLLLVRSDGVIGRHAGSLPDVYPPGSLDELRDEWE